MKEMMRILNKVKVDLDDYRIDDLKDIEKANLKKVIRKRLKKDVCISIRVKKQLMTACLVLGMLGIGSSMVFAGIHVIGYDFEYLLGVGKDTFKDYKTVVNEVIYDKGVYVKLNEVMMDNTDLIINATLQFDEPLLKESESMPIRPQAKVYINGKKLERGAHGSIHRLTDTQFIYNIGYNINTEPLPSGNMHVKIVFSHMRVGDTVLRGEWKFEFDTNRDQLLMDLESYEIGRSFTIEEQQNVDILNVELTEIATAIHFKTDQTKYEVEFKVEDDLGTVYALNSLSVSFGEENIGYQRLDPINPDATKLIITPYFALVPEKSGKSPGQDEYTLLEEEQFVIDLKK